MTAIPHHGVGSRGINAAGVRSKVGARLVRPSKGAKPTSRARQSGRSNGSAQPSGSEYDGVATSGALGALDGGLIGVGVGVGNAGTAGQSRYGLRHLRLVVSGGSVRLGSGAFVFLVLGLLTSTLLALLFLNTALAENSFQLQEIRQDSREMTLREQVLSGELAAAESPIGLQERAVELGMVAAGSPVFLRLTDGKVLGEPDPAVAPPAPKIKKPKADKPATTSPNSGEVPVGTTSGEVPVVGGTAGSTSGATSGSTGETPAQLGRRVASESAVGGTSGESPVGIVSGATR